MTRCDSKQSDRRPFGLSSILLPVAKRVNTDAHRFCKTGLCQANETTKRNNVFTALELARDQPLSDSRRHRTGELLRSEFGNVRHINYSMEER